MTNCGVWHGITTGVCIKRLDFSSSFSILLFSSHTYPRL